MSTPQTPNSTEPHLSRRLTLPLLILYGLGVTVGAGIYVLVGTTAAHAGTYAPVAFLAAAIVVSFTGFSYAELSARFPVSAGEAAYVDAGLRSKRIALLVGLLVASVGIISSSAIMVGASAYLQDLTSVDSRILTFLIAFVLGGVAILGVLESVTMAAVFTVLEIIGLLLVLMYGLGGNPEILLQLDRLVPPLEGQVWLGIGAASLLAFFAFVGFEDLANIAEEAINPDRNMPRAIIWTLVLATLLYLAVVSVVVLIVPIDALSQSAAPLNLMFTDASPALRGGFNLIASVATLNGVLIQMIMSSRVIYGLSKQNQLPAQLGYIHPQTKTPLVATILVAAIVLALSLFVAIERLAELTSQVALAIFAIVNLSLIFLKRREQRTAIGFQVPIFVPVTGLVTCVALFSFGLI
ncbi:MAG: APC family permease [Hyphomonadaceae bacterium]|nr:APC family permease [Hyphomonadaceae bacterium]